MRVVTSIEWTGVTWNPIRGCSIVSEGCRNCYAMRMAHRFSGPGAPYEGLTRMTGDGPKWTGKIRLVPEVLEAPLRWRKPRLVFVNSMSDLFHEDVPDEYIARVFATMLQTPQHTYQILTKRPERMRDGMLREIPNAIHAACLLPSTSYCRDAWPPSNVWLGVSAENQGAADERIPRLLQTPAAVRFVSAEPLLGPIDLRNLDTAPELSLDALNGVEVMSEVPAQGPALDWIIAGGESGPGARPCHVEWIRSIVEQCREADVACFVKQLGSQPIHTHDRECTGRFRAYPMRLKSRKGGDPSEWPADLRVREMP